MISKVVFIGANRYGEDSPLLDFVDVCRNKCIDELVLTDHARTVYPTKTLGPFEQALKELGRGVCRTGPAGRGCGQKVCRGTYLHGVRKLSLDRFFRSNRSVGWPDIELLQIGVTCAARRCVSFLADHAGSYQFPAYTTRGGSRG